MKTVFYCSGVWLRRVGLMGLLVLLFCLSANAQRGGYKGLTNRNGMLVFDSKESFRSVYDQLEAQIDAHESNPNAKSGPILLGDCEDDNAVLANFEAQLGIQSMRRKYLLKECQDLAKGLTPEQLTPNPIPDEILAAFLNEKGEMQVGQMIYLIPSIASYSIVMDGDLKTLRALERGENPGKFSNVEVHSDLGIHVDFEVTPVGENVLEFSYSGDPLPKGSKFFWNFGDGTVSTEENPVHEFRGKAEESYVRLVVTIGSSSNSRDGGLLDVFVGIGKWVLTNIKCAPFIIKNETGVPGELCFGIVTLGSHPIESYSCDFGDGGTSTEANPCHVYTCDKTYWVKVTVVFADSCGTKSFIRPVNVNSYSCCNGLTSKSGFAYYQGGERRIWHKQGQFVLPYLYTKITTEMIHYKKKSNGKWKRTKANLALDRDGYDYTKSAEGCACQTPYDISDYKASSNKKKIKMNKTLWWTQAKVALSDPWQVQFLVDGSVIKTQDTPVTCD